MDRERSRSRDDGKGARGKDAKGKIFKGKDAKGKDAEGGKGKDAKGKQHEAHVNSENVIGQNAQGQHSKGGGEGPATVPLESEWIMMPNGELLWREGLTSGRMRLFLDRISACDVSMTS